MRVQSPKYTTPAGQGFGELYGRLEPFDTDVRQPARPPPLAFHHPDPPPPLQPDDEYLINLFYSNFHPAHPLLVPRSFYATQAYPQYLRLVLQFIGSNYASSISSDSLRASAASALRDSNHKTVHMVQALLLYAIALHGRNEAEEAMVMLTQAVDLALELGLNQIGFASAHGMGQAILEESFRRTWWEVYVVDGYIAAFHRCTGFRSNTVELQALLPCEESAYTDGISIPEPPSLESFDARFFADEELLFSSYCYRIEAIRITARVLALAGANNAHKDEVQAVDNALAGWAHHLPVSKVDITDPHGEVDHMILQAHFIIQCASIFLHFPRSDLLLTLPATAEIVCAQNVPQMSPVSAQHIIKAMKASNELSNLAALPMQVQKHTPFFVCGLVLSSIVQLSACSVHAYSCLQQLRDKVILMTGVLRSLSSTWAISRHVLQQLKKVADEVFSTRFHDKVTAASSSYDSGVDMSGVDINGVTFDTSWLDSLCNEGL
ncbi:hypothetical protein MBLNU459_g6053t1 [Dothideomycetes sp. NU459]